MNNHARERIAFDVETGRILEILSSEIYDSPNALLRENVQNAYDAILMRCTAQGLSIAEHQIIIEVGDGQLVIRDDGIGMPIDVLTNNFWKAGSSGKKTELAQRSGVIGTFGIGAMANFGVCTALRVETRHVDSDVTLISSVRRDDLRIAQDCIDLERVADERPPGTTIIAQLDPSFSITEASICDYLQQYIRFLPVAVVVSGRLISQQSFEDALEHRASGFALHSTRTITHGGFSGTLRTLINEQGQILARFGDVSLNNISLAGEAFLVQQGGQTMGFRNLFGLAPVPVSGLYQFGGFVNLNILHPTAGREALSRESIQHIGSIVALVEAEVSNDVAGTEAADRNVCFQQHILAHGTTDLARNVRISVLPRREEVALGQLGNYESEKQKHFYAGRDQTILQRFASEQANLLHVSQTNPRRKLQLRYLQNVLRIEQVPEQTIVDRIPGTQLSLEEAMFLVRLRGVLMDDYLMPNVEAGFAIISHGVAFHVGSKEETTEIFIARDLPAVQTVLECFRTARDVFDGFVKDFVREHLYPHIRDYVPSSTRQGRDALYRRLRENKELFRYEESDFGELESLLADYLAGKTDLGEVLRTSRSRVSPQRQQVRREQVGSVEEEMPDIIESPGGAPAQSEYEAAPPILRPELSSGMKVLTVAAEHEKLNRFRMFLAVSDRLFRTEGEFFRWPHTTKLIWGVHRVIYIVTDETGQLSLYYDIELKEPLAAGTTGGGMFPTTTIITKNRLYVPVPRVLEPAFEITGGAKEFYVRFDTIP